MPARADRSKGFLNRARAVTLVVAICLIGVIGTPSPRAAAAATPRPAIVAASLVDLSGRFEVAVFEPRTPDAAETYRYALTTTTGRRYELHFATRPAITSGSTVRVTGTQHDNTIDVTSIDVTGYAAAATGAGTLTGTHTVLVILASSGTPDSTTPAQAQQQVGTDDDAWYRTTSHGVFGLDATVTPWVTIPVYDCDNDYYAIAANAQGAASRLHYTPSDYDHVMIYIPSTGCSWGGMGDMPGRITEIYGEMDARVTVHELGHNLGLDHAHSRSCTLNSAQVPDGGSCVTTEYGDPFDAMGGAFTGVGTFDAPHQAELGWLQGSTTVTSTATLTIAPIEASSGMQAVKIDSASGQYVLEYRQATGNDAFLSAYPNITGGVLVHATRYGTATDLIDETSDGAFDFDDAALESGDSWTTPEGVTIAVGAVGPGGASVTITVPPPVVRSVSPATSLPSGGGRVTVRGSGFFHVSAVKFGSVNARNVWCPTPARCVVAVPRGNVGTVDVVVVTSAGSSSVSSADRFTYARRHTTTAFTVSKGTATVGEGVSFVARVWPASAAGGVTFKLDGASIPGCRPAPLAGGLAVCTVRMTRSGRLHFAAHYGGGTDDAASDGQDVIVRVNVARR